jgi:hypothetical protein
MYSGAHVFSVSVHVILYLLNGRLIFLKLFPPNPIMANTRDMPFEFDGYSSINRLVSFRHGEERAATRFMKLSPDGKMLALGDDFGYLEV